MGWQLVFVCKLRLWSGLTALSRRGYAIASSAADIMNESQVPHIRSVLERNLTFTKVCEPFLSVSQTHSKCLLWNDVLSNSTYAVGRRSLILPAWLKFFCRPQSHIFTCSALIYGIYFKRVFPLGWCHILFGRGLCKTADNAEIIFKQLCKSREDLTLEMMRW